MQAIDRLGSMSRAAAALGISQPAISQHLRRTEERLGLRLVVRTDGATRLSEAGRAILSIAEPVTQSLRFVADRLEEIRSLGSGRLRMTGFSSASALMPRLLRSIAAAHPDVTITYEEREPLDALEAVTAGDSDLAVLYRYASVPLEAEWLAQDELHVQSLFHDELYAAIGPGHPLVDAEMIALEDLEDDDWLLPSGPERACMIELCRAAGFVPATTFCADNVAATLAMVQEGGPVTLVPRLALHSTQLPRDVALRRLASRPAREVVVASSALHHGLPLVQTVAGDLRAMQIDAWPITPMIGQQRTTGTRRTSSPGRST